MIPVIIYTFDSGAYVGPGWKTRVHIGLPGTFGETFDDLLFTDEEIGGANWTNDQLATAVALRLSTMYNQFFTVTYHTPEEVPVDA